MGKEFRAGLSVVGALLVGFCVLLYARFARGPVGIPDASIETHEHVPSIHTVRRTVRATPTIVKGGGDYGLSNEPSGSMNNPRRPSHDQEFDGEQDREQSFLPIARNPQDDRLSNDSQPDAVAPSPTMSVTVQPRENLQQLTVRIYGSTDYHHAVWQWLFDRDQVEAVQPGARLELPTRATLLRTHPQLVPAE